MPDQLKLLPYERLCLVDDQDRVFALLPYVNQVCVQQFDLGIFAALGWQAEFAADGLEQLELGWKDRHRQVSGLVFSVVVVYLVDAAGNGRFADAHVAVYNGQSLAFFCGIGDLGQCRLVLAREKKEPGIGRQRERSLSQTQCAEIQHECLP